MYLRLWILLLYNFFNTKCCFIGFIKISVSYKDKEGQPIRTNRFDIELTMCIISTVITTPQCEYNSE